MENTENTLNDLQSINKRIDELEEIVQKREREFDAKWFTKDNLNNMSAEAGFNEYNKQKKEYLGKDAQELNSLLDRERMMREPTFKEIPDYGDVMSLSGFIETVNDGGFIDYDGYGRYVKDGQMSDIEIYPSDVKKGNIRKEFDKIVWFNR